jgi:hypothetical protein
MIWFKVRNGLWHILDASLKGERGGQARVSACGHTVEGGPVLVRQEMPQDESPDSGLYAGKVCWPCRKTLLTLAKIKLNMAALRALAPDEPLHLNQRGMQRGLGRRKPL